MRSLERLDRWISGNVKRFTSRVSGVPGAAEMLEIRRDILEEIRDKIQPLGQGKNVFPYQTVSIRVGAADAGQRAVRESAFSESGGMETEITGLLTEANCRIPAGFTVDVAVFEDAALSASARPFQIEYAGQKAPPARKAERPAIHLRVVRGESEAPEYTLDAERVNIGRLKEVVGEKDGLRRINDVAFSDRETTVSREHATIRYDLASQKFRLFDMGSQRGSSVFREGRRIVVPRGPTRGVQLRSGDEIHLGDVRLKFELSESTQEA